MSAPAKLPGNIQKWVSALLTSLLILLMPACSKKAGCIDPNAANYGYEAKKDDGSCLYHMSFWLSTDKHGWVRIFVDGEFAGELNCAWVSGQPVCGVNDSNNSRSQTFCVLNVPLAPGVHAVRVEGQDGTVWEDQYELGENCLSVMIREV